MHFLVHVILPNTLQPGCSEKQVETALVDALKPFWTEDGTNSDGWWDWYELGGRFDGSVAPSTPLPSPAPSGFLQRLFAPKAPSNVARVEDVVASWSLERAPFVVLTPDGTAHGEDDWAKDDFPAWSARFRELVSHYGGHLVAGVDCHA
jgi:hypothetical protein